MVSSVQLPEVVVKQAYSQWRKELAVAIISQNKERERHVCSGYSTNAEFRCVAPTAEEVVSSEPKQ